MISTVVSSTAVIVGDGVEVVIVVMGRERMLLFVILALLLYVFGCSVGHRVIVVGDKVLCITKMFQWFPHSVTLGKSFPLNVVMYLVPLASAMHIEYLLHFIFGFSLDKIWWWLGIICSM